MDMTDIKWITDPMDVMEAMLKSNFWCYRTDEELATLYERVTKIAEEYKSHHTEDTEI